MNKQDWKGGLRRQTEVVVDREWQARIVDKISGRPRGRFAFRPVLAWSFAGALGMVFIATWWLHRPLSHVAVMQDPATEVLHFDAHAVGRRLTPDTQAVVVEQTPLRTRVELMQGSLGFEIEPSGREFCVDAGAVKVTVLGTSFSVTRENTQVTVAVARGRVRVDSAGVAVILSDGEKRTYGIAEAKKKDESSKNAPVAAPANPVPQGFASRPKSIARVVDAQKPRPTDPRDTVEDLMRAADNARNARAWAEAISFYGRVVKDHLSDSRAGLASYSQGRILLYQLKKPGDAARAFAQARALTLPPNLTKDAHAREVEGWHMAGDVDRAKAAARDYFQHYPKDETSALLRDLARTP